MPDTTADPVAAALEEIRADVQAGTEAAQRGDLAALSFAAGRVAGGAEQLIRTIEALLDGHVPVPLYLPARHGDGRDGASACTHEPDHASHFEGEDGEWLCGDSPDGHDCGKCREELIDGGDGWPCGVYTGAYEALTGKKVTGD
jgi:hypothetical protein